MNTTKTFKKSFIKNASQKRIGIATAIAAVFLIAAVGSASAIVIDSCNFLANVNGGYYELTANLTCGPGEDGIIIGADNVIIDGKGYKITGAENSTACAPTGQTNCVIGINGVENPAGYDNVTIKDLEIENFCTGICLTGPHSMNLVEENNITGCCIHHNGNASAGVTHGIHLIKVSNSTISQNEIYNNTGVFSCGCAGAGNGIFLFGEPGAPDYGYARNNTITCNNIHHNRKAGYFMKAAPMFNTIAYNHVHENGGSGIVVRCMMSNYNIIEYNNASYNKGTGIFIRGDANVVRYNTVLGNTNGSEYATCGTTTPAYEHTRYGAGIKSAGNGVANIDMQNNLACDNEVYDIQDGMPGGAFVATSDYNTFNSTKCIGYRGDDALGACNSRYTCDDLISVYYDFDKDDDCSQATCTCSICGGRGTCACCNPGLFNSSGAGQHCIDVCNTSTGNDPDDCNASVYGDPKIPPLSELPGPTPTPTPTPPPGEEVTVSATVAVAAPEVVCKCEGPDDDPVEPGTQVEPNLWPDTKTVMKCAIACDPNGIGDIKYVNATTYYPDGTIKETQTMHVANESEKAVCCCDTTGLPNETCQVYAGYITMEACDPAGNYTVNVTATDNSGATGELSNQFEYLSIIGLDLDLNAVGFGTIVPGETKIVPGDDVWGAPNLTVHSIGNDPIDIEVSATDMTSDGNVITKDNIDCEIDALGSQWLSEPYEFGIGLECCSYENVNLSLHVPEGTAQGAYTGKVTFVAKHA